MKKNNSKNKVILLVAILVLVLIVCIMEIAINRIEHKDEIESRKAIKEYGYETMGVYKDPEVTKNMDKNISYENISLLQTLNGEFPASTVTKQVKTVFVKNIPDIIEKTKNMSNDELKNYFAENTFNIEQDLRINEESSFLNMINTFRKFSSNLRTDYKSCEFLKDEDLKLVFTYENGESVECAIVGTNANTILFKF